MQTKHLIKLAPIYDKKNSQKSGNRGNIPKHIKGHIQQTHCQHHTQCAKTTSIPLKTGNKTGMSALTSLIQHSSRNPSHRNQTTRRNKWIQIGLEEVKLIICR